MKKAALTPRSPKARCARRAVIASMVPVGTRALASPRQPFSEEFGAWVPLATMTAA